MARNDRSICIAMVKVGKLQEPAEVIAWRRLCETNSFSLNDAPLEADLGPDVKTDRSAPCMEAPWRSCGPCFRFRINAKLKFRFICWSSAHFPWCRKWSALTSKRVAGRSSLLEWTTLVPTLLATKSISCETYTDVNLWPWDGGIFCRIRARYPQSQTWT